MNSISSYILEKDVDTANDYLEQFAKLMRMILNFAAKPTIEVSDEIDLLKLYMQTEAMRFENKFVFDFNFKNDFDPDDFLIPTMILQPFVENAILHGISRKTERNPKIIVHFWEEKDSLLCSVEDNGIGRKAAAELNIKYKTHESLALSITERRLKMIEPKNGIPATYKIIDLTDADGNPCGTKVVFQFPII